MAREALLALSSDWAFMVTKDSAASYARDRAGMHELRFRKLADGIVAGLDVTAEAVRQRAEDGPFAHLDARCSRSSYSALSRARIAVRSRRISEMP